MICRELHNERRGVAGEHLGFLQHDTGENDRRHADEVCGGGNQRRAAEQRTGNHCDKRYLGTAGDKGCGHDCHTAIAFVFNGTRSHNTRDTAAGTDEHRDKGFAGKSELAEDTVEYKRDTRHVTASLQKCKQQEQNQHLRHKAEHRADTGNNTVKNQPAEPIGSAGRLQTVFNQHGDTGHPHAEICRVGRVRSLFAKVRNCIEIRDSDDIVVSLFALRNTVVICGERGNLKRFLILHINLCGLCVCLEIFELFQRGVGIKIFRLRIKLRNKCLHGMERIIIFFCAFIICGGADSEQMPAVSEYAVVHPVRRGGADRHHGQIIHKEHDRRKNRKTQPAVGHNLVDLIGNRELSGALLLVAGLDDGSDIKISFVGDDGFRIIVHFRLSRLDVGFDVRLDALVKLQLFQNLVVSFKNFDGIPSLLLFRQRMHGSLFDMRDCMLNAARKGVLRNGFAVLCGINCSLCRFHDARALERGNLNNFAAKLTGKLCGIDLIAALADNIDHVDCNDHRNAELRKLRRQIQVSLKVGAVDDVQNRVGSFADQIIPRNNLFQSVRGE